MLRDTLEQAGSTGSWECGQSFPVLGCFSTEFCSLEYGERSLWFAFKPGQQSDDRSLWLRCRPSTSVRAVDGMRYHESGAFIDSIKEGLDCLCDSKTMSI